MAFADEFVERRMLKFACYKCDHPAMLITKKEELEVNEDGSKKYKVELACPRCKATDEFILNDGAEDVAGIALNAKKEPDLNKVI
ncbi:hypothetical protein RD055328_13190 [Companilactobacillus sp. RD055328]|uniref:hypothetical protein n=1 Tax=Companilactobacillus sp. RD055328 TaxID=2916634 RepID=UPI001FC834F5|nr:hypothetical protein [Companilactobacillus sp. RD055328]GKQ43396.1 hypothetical protein RD055328_13190 [Companilactobacillus sp. RD055328]